MNSPARRRSIEVPGTPHKAPIPTGCRIGDVVFSSAINGSDPATGEIPDDGEAQVRFAFVNLERFLVEAGVTAEDVIRMTVHLSDRSLRAALDTEWLRLFPDADSRPARHAMNLQLNRNMLIQLEIVAVGGH
ncbi:RidA family protein [Streptomyces sp. NPDC006872]|uniref:RidA family protein n=1 Tax=Streptomyces sp. NPDC006872 TaxID=3155720 RepID=UPI00340B9948